jgi:hypothetical protein
MNYSSVMFMIHETLPDIKISKIMQWPSKKSPPLTYGSDFFYK